MCDLSPFHSEKASVAQIRAVIGTILANKYKSRPSNAEPGTHPIKRVLEFWAKYLREAVLPKSTDTDFRGAHIMAMHVLAGVLARQDKIALDFVPVLQEVLAAESNKAEDLARSMGMLVKDLDFLQPENHARVNKLHKQWAYSHFIKPLYERAVPTSTGPAAVRYAIAVLSAVEHCQFPVYQDDLQILNRLIITMLSTRPASSEVASALATLHEILQNEPSSLQEHTHTVITSVLGIYQAARGESPAVRNVANTRRVELAKCRRQALLILRIIPAHFEQEILPLSPKVQRLLAVASADPVRELRKLAISAREAWGKLG
jgi:DNA repair/transcription protein MET18/MMS19